MSLMGMEHERKLYDIFEKKLTEISETIKDHGDPLIAAWNEYLKSLPVTLHGSEHFSEGLPFGIFNPMYTDPVNKIICFDSDFAAKVMVLGLP